VDQDGLVFIPGFGEGILVTSQVAIRTAAALSAQASDAARTPFKLELHQTTADVLTDSEIAELIRRAREALASNSGVLYTNAAVEARVHPVDAQQLLIDGRNASAVDMARIASLPAALVDATTAGASLTYETTQGRNQQAVDYGLAAYMAAVTSRLSLDDVVPRGQRVAFQAGDFQALVGNPTGPPVAD
jgi:type III secretory pathway component EscV